MADAQRRDRRPLLAGMASGLVVLLFFGWFVVFGPGHSSDAEPSAIEAMSTKGEPRATVAPSTVGSVGPIMTAGQAAATSNSVSLLTEAEAEPALAREAKEDLSRIELRGQWVAQLASKYVGIVDPQQLTSWGSHQFLAADIYAEHESLKDSIEGVDVLLLDSRTYGTGRTFEGKPFWVTVATDASFTSADDIVAWCAAQFPDLTGTALNNRCLPTQLGPLDG